MLIYVCINRLIKTQKKGGFSMSCPSGSHSSGTVYGETGCTSAKKCGFLWQQNTSYTQIYDKCVTDKDSSPVGDYYRETSYGACC